MSAWGQLDQLLTCAICLDRYKNPKLLPCQHTFCMEPCMEGLVDYGRRQIKCPECRAEHRIPYQGVQTLPTNVTLIRFLDLHRNITGEEPEPPPAMLERCGVCSEKSCVERCSHCDKKICSDCKEAHLDIMRREINRINNQVRRGLNRLSDMLLQTQKNNEKLENNCDSVKEEVEELVRRYVKDVKDTEERLKHELEVYLQTETKNIIKLKDDLDVEIANMNSNCDLVDKYIVDDMEWTDSELVEYKEIFLKTLDFLRNFDADTSDFARRVRLQHNSDPEVLHKTLLAFGEIKINTPPAPVAPPTTAPSQSSNFLTPAPSIGLMRSQSDHRLASQFQRRQEGGSRNQYLGGHASDSERDSSSSIFSRNKREGETGYRRYGDRSGVRDYDSSDRESSTTTGRSRFLRPSDDSSGYSSSRWRDSTDDLGSGFRSRFARELVEDSGHESENHSHSTSSRSVRFEEPAPAQSYQPPPKEHVLDTEDATRGPLSGVIRLLDSPYVLERLHQNEIKQKADQVEKERKALEPLPAPVPTPAPPAVTRPRPARQVSEDEIEKQKKQNQLAAASQSSATATPAAPAPASPPPVATPPQSPLATVPETPSTKPISKRLASLKDDDTSSRSSRQDSRSQDSGESGGSSRGSPFEDAQTSPVDSTPPRTYRWRRSSTDADALMDSSTPSTRTSSAEPKRPESPRQGRDPPPRTQTRQVNHREVSPEVELDPSYYPSAYVPQRSGSRVELHPAAVSRVSEVPGNKFSRTPTSPTDGSPGSTGGTRRVLPYNLRHHSDTRFDSKVPGGQSGGVGSHRTMTRDLLSPNSERPPSRSSALTSKFRDDHAAPTPPARRITLEDVTGQDRPNYTRYRTSNAGGRPPSSDTSADTTSRSGTTNSAGNRSPTPRLPPLFPRPSDSPGGQQSSKDIIFVYLLNIRIIDLTK